MISDRDGLLDRDPPINLEAEMNVLGSILLLPEVCDDLALRVVPEDFWDPANGTLYRHLFEMYNTGQKIDVTLLRERLRKAGEYETIGGAAYLGKVIHSVTTAAHAAHYAEIVREKSTFRNLISKATEIVKEAYDWDGNANEAINAAEQKIFGIQDDRGSNASLKGVKEVLNVAMERIDARMRGEHADGAVDSGFSELDGMTGGLHGSELLILAARPSMGKTALAMNIAENVAMRGNAPVLFVSLEMSAIELIERMMCSVARVNGHRLRNGTISQEDRKKLVEKAAEISESPLYIDDAPGRTVAEIAAAARRIKRIEKNSSDRPSPLGLIVIDYLQLVEPDNPRDPRQEQVAKIARRLKGLSRELDVPVLCLAQLNRQAEDSKEHRPRLSHLRESGAIEQDADVVMFVHREEYYLRGEAQKEVAGQANIFIEKQRNGPTGDINLVWRKEFTRFEDRAPERFDELDEFNQDFES